MTSDERDKLITVQQSDKWTGYGARKDTTTATDAAARVLVDLYGLPVEKHGGVGGYHCGAYHDALPEFFLSVRHCEFGGLIWFAGFGALRERYDEVAAEVPNGHISVPQRLDDPSPSEARRFPFMTVWSTDFETMHMAVTWLQTYGAKFNDKLAVVDRPRGLGPLRP